MTVREIRGTSSVDVSPDLISTVADAVTECQVRPLDACYPLVFFEAIRVTIGD